MNPRKHHNIIFYFLLMTAFSSTLFAAIDTDKLLPIKINADKIDVKADVHQIIYMGHVELTQGSTHLIADKAITIGDSHDKLSEAIVFGNKTTLAHAWSETEADKPPTHIYADVIHYYPDKHLVTLVGHAKVIQDKNSLEAPKINYNLETKHVTTESNTSARTHITFFPEKKS